MPAIHRPELQRSNQRGAALIVAVTAVAILTAISVDLAYNTRVSLQRAVNARDELRAYYLAKSALSMSRLVLRFQQQIDGIGGQTGAGFSMRLWELIPVDSSATMLFLGGARGDSTSSGEPSAGAQQITRTFGDFEGAFRASIEDEDKKINLRQFDGLSALPAAQAIRLAQLINDPKWNFLFDQEDANGWRVSRKDLFAALRDWIDTDETSTNFSGDPVKPFEPGFGDENYLYSRLTDRYRAKNAPFDSLDEIFMVAGVTDSFFAAFGDKLTVYPLVDKAINVNTNDPAEMVINALVMSDPPGVIQPSLADPTFVKRLREALAILNPIPFLSINAQQFAGALTALGVKVQPIFLAKKSDPGRNPFGDRSVSTTFHIRAAGQAGSVQKTIDAVVTFDRRAGALAQDQGRLLHWHEE